MKTFPTLTSLDTPNLWMSLHQGVCWLRDEMDTGHYPTAEEISNRLEALAEIAKVIHYIDHLRGVALPGRYPKRNPSDDGLA